MRKNKKNMAIVLRFLKETKLLSLWKEYINYEKNEGERFNKRHWSDQECVDGVLGATIFSSFVIRKLEEISGKRYYEGTCIYLRFVFWLKMSGLLDKYTVSQDSLNYLKHTQEECISNDIKIDPITKKAKLFFKERK